MWFDRWYASASLRRFNRRQGWYTICVIKSNRRLDGIRVRDHDQHQRHMRYARVSVAAADQAKIYHVREVRSGFLVPEAGVGSGGLSRAAV